jgi:hypothetical protein
MKRLFVAAMLLLSGASSQAQELFVFTEPASNMPAHTLGLRASNWLMWKNEGGVEYHLIPEVMWGINKNLMIHVEGFFANRDGGFHAEGAGLYAKYRFFSNDQIYKHFRMAAFGRITTNNAPIHQEEIMTNGHNSGYTLGLITTQLLHRQAISLTASYERAMNNAGGNEIPSTHARDAINMALSTGRLFYPKKYNSYKQVNVNGILEVLSQVQPETGAYYVDIAPSVQMIFNSQTRLDIGYRQQLWAEMERSAPNGLLIRLEHVLFNVRL